MQKSIPYLTLAASIAALLIAGFMALGKSSSPDIRYVRSADLIYGYEGMIEAQAELSEKSNAWQANLDTLKQDYQRALGEVQAGEGAPSELSQEERSALQSRAVNYQKYAAVVQERALEEEKELLAGVLSQVNAFVEQYAQEKGYDLIVGTTTDGNVLYGDPALDITEDLLEALNKNYRGE